MARSSSALFCALMALVLMLALLAVPGCEAHGWLANTGKEDKTTAGRHTRLVMTQLKHMRTLKQSWGSNASEPNASAYPPSYAPCYGTYGTYGTYGAYPPAYGSYGSYGAYGCGTYPPAYAPAYPAKTPASPAKTKW